MFRPMKPETIARRAAARKAERLAALPEMIARREALAAKMSHPDDAAYWQASADMLRRELTQQSLTPFQGLKAR